MAKKLRFSRFAVARSIVNTAGQPTMEFNDSINKVVSQIEKTVQSLSDQVDDQSLTLTMLLATQRQAAIHGSYTVPGLACTASDAGSNVTVTVAAHSRRYGDETSLSISTGTITGLTYSTAYAVYYDDKTRKLNNPTFIATTNLSIAQNNYIEGRHLVGTFTTPAALGVATKGGVVPPGSGYKTTGTGTGFTL